MCHEQGRQSEFSRVTSTRIVKPDYIDTSSRAAGHQIRTSVPGAMENGSALPCYDCHDSHGSVSRALILDNQSMYGDDTSQVVVTSGFGAGSGNDLLVCSQCHDTGNSVTKVGKDNVASIGKLVEGLNPVDPYNSATYSDPTRRHHPGQPAGFGAHLPCEQRRLPKAGSVLSMYPVPTG